ncbi:heavy metal-(Cd/Co/Hg/Pb/Zn)-translocating P-type ATPase [Lachnospiraceae bacterium KM106-2]|nr:heavy metal-(Cd/Co/Hg/Pb/Zn)-translocating P-type ATPase [Lachnospiraceae bacterium KM106-2]
MKKKFKLVDLDCANCAAKMEEAINKIEGVSKATVSFMAQKLTIEAEESQFERIVDEAQKEIKRIEPDCSIEM